MKKSIPLSSLYAISPMQENTAILLEQIHSAIKGGVQLVQYRDKSANTLLRWEQAQALRALCAQHEVLFLINDDIELAKSCGADGVHLGQSDMPVEQARQRLGADAIIGITCHNSLDLAEQAARLGADYLSFGCFFPSSTKPLAKPAELLILQKAKAQFQLPIVAIGGITLENAPQLITAGADILAVCAGIFEQPDIAQAARAFKRDVPLPK